MSGPSYESYLARQQERHDERMAEAAEDEMRACVVCGEWTPTDVLVDGLCEECEAVTP